MSVEPAIAIAGGGIAGLTASIALREAGFETSVFEAKPDFGQLGVAVLLAPNGVKALDALGRGIGAAIRRVGYELPAHHPIPWLAPDGTLIQNMEYGDLVADFGAPQITIRRSDLHRILLDAHGTDGLFASAAVQNLEQGDGLVRASFEGIGTRYFDVLVGADGIRSTVLAKLHGEQPTRYAGAGSLRGITRELELPRELAQGVWVLSPGVILMCSTIGPRELYWSAIVQTEEGSWPVAIDSAVERLLELVEGWERMPEIIRSADSSTLVSREVRDRVPLDWWGRGRVTLVGDAAHAVTNFWGQGAGIAAEDASVLARCADAYRDDIEQGLRAYEAQRLPRANRIVNASFAAERDAEGRPWREFIEWLYSYDSDAVSAR